MEYKVTDAELTGIADAIRQKGGTVELLEFPDGFRSAISAISSNQILFDTTSGWDNQSDLISEIDTIYVYTDHQHDSDNNPVAGMKVGDGSTYLIDLPFTDAIAMEHIADNVRHITSAERVFWNSKVSCYYDSAEKLIFTTD